AEAPPVADAVVRHAPLDGAFEVRQCLRGERVDRLGDASLRLRQARDVGEDRRVADRGLRGARPAGHSLLEREGLRLCRRARAWFPVFAPAAFAVGHEEDGRPAYRSLRRSRSGRLEGGTKVTQAVPFEARFARTSGNGMAELVAAASEVRYLGGVA